MVNSIKKLRDVCQKSVLPVNTWYQVHVGRKISIYLTWLFIKLGVSPDAVSIGIIPFGLFVTYFFTLGTYYGFLIGGLLLQFWYLLDLSDGEVARYHKQRSAKGSFLDKVNHIFVHPAIFLSMGIGFYNKFNNPLFILLGGITACALLMQDLINLHKLVALVRYKVVKDIQIGVDETKEIPGSLFHKIFKKITSWIYKVPGMMNIITIATIFNLTYYVFLFYSFTFLILVIIKTSYNISIPRDRFK